MARHIPGGDSPGQSRGNAQSLTSQERAQTGDAGSKERAQSAGIHHPGPRQAMAADVPAGHHESRYQARPSDEGARVGSDDLQRLGAISRPESDYVRQPRNRDSGDETVQPDVDNVVTSEPLSPGGPASCSERCPDSEQQREGVDRNCKGTDLRNRQQELS
jgi:hypothetical protein